MLALVAFGVQVALTLYWIVRIAALLAEVPGPDPAGPFISFALFFAAGPLVGIGMLLFGPGRRWFGPQDVEASASASVAREW